MAKRYRNLLLPWLLAALAAGGCDGSSSASGGPTAPPSPMIVFTADGPATAGSVTMRAGAGSTASTLELEIVATDLVNVQTMDFVLAYPGSLLRFDGFEAGPFLGPASLILEQATANSLTVLLTRLDPSGASGSGVVMTVTFSAAAGGDGRFDFLEPEAGDPFGLEIPGIDWIGSTVRVVL